MHTRPLTMNAQVDLWAIGCIMGKLIDAQPLFPRAVAYIYFTSNEHIHIYIYIYIYIYIHIYIYICVCVCMHMFTYISGCVLLGEGREGGDGPRLHRLVP